MALNTKSQTLLAGLLQRKNALIEQITNTPEKQLAALDAEIQRAQAQAQSEAEQERERKLKPLYERQRAQVQSIVADVQTLQKKLDETRAIDREISQLGGRPNILAPTVLDQSVSAVLEYWRRHDPELLGLPRLPTHAEQVAMNRRHDAEARVERSKNLLPLLEAQKKANNNHFSQTQRRIEEVQDELRRAEKALAEL